MSRLELAGTWLTPPDPDRPLLVVGPALGTTVEALWGRCARELAGAYAVLGWDLPGHSRSPVPDRSFVIADLADAVLALAGRPCAYAGVSIGGAVGLQLALDRPDRVSAVTLLCTAARIGTPAGWHERAALVRAEGTVALMDSAPERWFAPGFAERHPETAAALLAALRDADDGGYAYACEALAAFDLSGRLGAVRPPVLAVAGRHDQPTPVPDLLALADGVPHGRLVVLEDVAHLAPAEAPATVAGLVTAHRPADDSYATGMAVRRAVLGDQHVDRAVVGSTDLTRDFQDLITRYAWGEIWTRPGLDRRSRSMVTLTALVALGHHEELAMHVRAARTNGLSVAEIREVLLQTAIYCGVPAANAAFRTAQRVLEEDGTP